MDKIGYIQNFDRRIWAGAVFVVPVLGVPVPIPAGKGMQNLGTSW